MIITVMTSPDNTLPDNNSPVTFSPLAICKEILNQGNNVTPLKLIKLAYISHGFYLGYLGHPIFLNKVEAWQYGPVIKEIYFAVINDFRKEVITPSFFDKATDELSDNAKRVIKAVINTYDQYDGLQLSTITHKEGSPWDITVKKSGINTIIPNDFIEQPIIPNDLIKQHYKSIIQ